MRYYENYFSNNFQASASSSSFFFAASTPHSSRASSVLSAYVYVFGFAFYLFIFASVWFRIEKRWSQMEKLKTTNEKNKCEKKRADKIRCIWDERKTKYGIIRTRAMLLQVSFACRYWYDVHRICDTYCIFFSSSSCACSKHIWTQETNKKPRTKACASLLSDERQRSAICSAGVPMYLTPQNVCKWIDIEGDSVMRKLPKPFAHRNCLSNIRWTVSRPERKLLNFSSDSVEQFFYGIDR